MLIVDYYEQWIDTYKRDAVREVTLNKYMTTLTWLKNHIPEMDTKELNRQEYQKILNLYAVDHERQTVMDFNHHLKSAVLDMIDDGLVDKDPTRRMS